MLRAVSDTIYKTLIEAFPPNESYTRAAFSQPPMPSVVAHFLVQTLRHRADLETRRVRSEWFDGSHPDVQQARADFAAALFEQSHIPAGRWATLLKQVVDQVTSYLVRPVPTLLDFIYQGKDDPLSQTSLHHRVAYFSAYPYLADALAAHTEAHPEAAVDRATASEVLYAAEKDRTASLSPEEWIALLEPLFNLFEAVQPEQPAPPVELVGSFFKNKGQRDVSERLFNFEADAIGRAALRRLLQRAMEPSAPAEKPPVRRQKPSSPSPIITQDSGPLPLWMQFQHGSAPPQHEEPTYDPQPALQQPQNDAVDESKPLWMRFRPEPSSSGAADPTPLSALEEDTMGPRGPANRDFFIERLFEGSEDFYERTLRRLQHTDTWSQASRIIAQEVFRRHKVNIYSEPAVLFTDLVEARFKQRA